MACQKRVDYAAGDMTHSTPMELSDLTKEIEMPEQQKERKTQRPWTKEEKEFLRLNRKKMTYKQMAEALERPACHIGTAIHRFKIKSSSSQKDEQVVKLKDAEDSTGAEDSTPIEVTETDHKPALAHGCRKDYFALDFSDYEELYNLLIEISKGNFRTPQEQALFIIHEYCRGHKISD